MVCWKDRITKEKSGRAINQSYIYLSSTTMNMQYLKYDKSIYVMSKRKRQ